MQIEQRPRHRVDHLEKVAGSREPWHPPSGYPRSFSAV